MTQILFFGRLRDIAGYAERHLDLPRGVETVAELRELLATRDCVLGEALNARGVRVAVNQVFCINDATPVRDAHEIAFMSPLSGG